MINNFQYIIMQKQLFIYFFLYFSYTLSAQQLEINYTAFVRQTYTEEEKKMWFDDSEMGRAQLKANEEPSEETYVMIISDKESSFTYQDRINNSQEQRFDIRYAPAGYGTIYRNLKDSVQKKNFDVYGKKYHSVDSLKILNWKITRETKTLLGYKVRKATLEDSLSITTVWFAPKIAVSTGPADFWGLPGLILEVEKSSKERTHTINYIAKSIKEIKNPKIIIPNMGTQIKESEIDLIYDEANKRQQEMYKNSQGVDKD